MNLLHKALRTDDLDAAFKIVMDALRIQTGDLAGQVIGKDDRRLWEGKNLGHRAGILSAWLRIEIRDAAAQE